MSTWSSACVYTSRRVRRTSREEEGRGEEEEGRGEEEEEEEEEEEGELLPLLDTWAALRMKQPTLLNTRESSYG